MFSNLRYIQFVKKQNVADHLRNEAHIFLRQSQPSSGIEILGKYIVSNYAYLASVNSVFFLLRG